jgi:hypothetical protein
MGCAGLLLLAVAEGWGLGLAVVLVVVVSGPVVLWIQRARRGSRMRRRMQQEWGRRVERARDYAQCHPTPAGTGVPREGHRSRGPARRHAGRPDLGRPPRVSPLGRGSPPSQATREEIPGGGQGGHETRSLAGSCARRSASASVARRIRNVFLSHATSGMRPDDRLCPLDNRNPGIPPRETATWDSRPGSVAPDLPVRGCRRRPDPLGLRHGKGRAPSLAIPRLCDAGPPRGHAVDSQAPGNRPHLRLPTRAVA